MRLEQIVKKMLDFQKDGIKYMNRIMVKVKATQHKNDYYKYINTKYNLMN